MVCSDTGLKSVRELMRGWPVVIIQGRLFQEVLDKASCWWMLLILELKKSRKAVH